MHLHSEIIRDGVTYTHPDHVCFIRDVEDEGYEVELYHGRWYYHGPAVRATTVQEIKDITDVRLGWDNLGFDVIVHPSVSDPELD